MSGKHIELYAGCGGLALGSTPTVLVERDADCCRTLRENFPEAQVIESPVSDVGWESFPDVDVVSGGFPCQSFSSIGTRSGLESANGEQVYVFLDVVRRTRPFTLAEYARIQGFPDDFRFSGSPASVYRQIGNSVPPPLARRLFSTLPQAGNQQPT